jgi:acetyl esterase
LVAHVESSQKKEGGQLLSELDPQVKALLEQFQQNAAQYPAPVDTLSAKEKIVATRQRMSSFAALRYPSESVTRTEDFEIPGPAGKIPVRLYVPQTEEPLPIAAPVFVFYHGGGFVSGDLESSDTLLRALANRAQCIVISVAYRLAPENPYPAANDDAWTVLTWVADHASEIGVDPQRLAVGGDSAGGLLAAWVAQKAAKNGPKLRLQVLLYPNLDATTSRPSWKEFGTGAYLVSHAEMIERYDAYLPQGINREDSKVSPLFATDLTDVAPALIITADHDPLHDEGDEYASKLKAANIVVDHTCWAGMVHGLASLAGVLDAGKVLIDQFGAALNALKLLCNRTNSRCKRSFINAAGHSMVPGGYRVTGFCL